MVAKAIVRKGAAAHAEVKQRINTALVRYEAFGAGVKRGDKSAQASGVKILESLGNLAAQEALTLRNSSELRRFFAAAISKIDIGALVRSKAASIQMSALQATNTLAHTPSHPHILTISILPCIVELLAAPGDASHIAADALRALAVPFFPTTVWQAIQDGNGSEKLLMIIEAASEGHGTPAAHLQLLQILLQSSTLTQRQLLADPAVAKRWTSAMVRLLQRAPMTPEHIIVTGAIHDMACHTEPFLSILQSDSSIYNTLVEVTGAALQDGNRADWWENDSSTPQLTGIACNLLDMLACIAPPDACSSMETQDRGICPTARHDTKGYTGRANIADTSAVKGLVSAMRHHIQDAAQPGQKIGANKLQALSAVLRAACVLLLPPVHDFGSDVCLSPWVGYLGLELPAQLLQLASLHRSSKNITTWCWQALSLLQPKLTDSERRQAVTETAFAEVPMLSRNASEPLYSICTALQISHACSAALTVTQPHAASGHSQTAPEHPQSGQNSVIQPDHVQQQLRHPTDAQNKGVLSNMLRAQQEHLWLFMHQCERPLQPACCSLTPGQLWLTGIASGVLSGEPGAIQYAWSVLQHASDKFYLGDSQACGAAVLASLQALAKAGRQHSLEPWMTQHLLQLQSEMQSKYCGGSLQKEVAYMDGTKAVFVPGPLRQHSNAQLQLWWAVATAACCNQLGAPSRIGDSFKALLDDPTAADVVFELQTTSEIIWAHASIMAARCPKLYNAIQQAKQQQQQQQQHAGHLHANNASSSSLGGGKSNRVIIVRLSKQVPAAPFRQVLEYIYTGQTSLGTDEDKHSLHKLAQALGLKQLAMLAGGATPMPGAVFSAFSLKALFPCQAVPICSPSPILLQSTADTAEQDSCENHERHVNQRAEYDEASSIVSSNDGCSDADDAAQQDTASKRHPALEDLTGATLTSHTPARLPTPAGLPTHADILLVPSQTNAARFTRPHVMRETHAADLAGTRATAPALTDSEIGEAGHSLVALAAHSAVLIAASPYFAAMLSDRWQEQSQAGGAQHDRSLPVAYLPTHDFEVALCFLYFCYTHELCLDPWESASAAVNVGVSAGVCIDGGVSRADIPCAVCWQARTAVRLAAAAKALIMPDLQEHCLQFLKGMHERLPHDCRRVVLSDVVRLQLWEVAAELT